VIEIDHNIDNSELIRNITPVVRFGSGAQNKFKIRTKKWIKAALGKYGEQHVEDGRISELQQLLAEASFNRTVWKGSS